MERYDPHAIEAKWQAIWAENHVHEVPNPEPGEDTSRMMYVLEMLPYPSGELHMGHVKNYTMGDVITLFRRRNGYRVVHPMGYDSFGLPAENAAIKSGLHPAVSTRDNINAIRSQMKRMGWSIDWTRELSTADPSYYRWTQWIFLRLLEAGLTYRREAPVKWCPVDQTVLANEQVIDGHCERCGAEVTKRELTQWYFKITEYAQELLDNLDVLEASWPDRVITAQRNWIGRSEGAHVTFDVVDGETMTVYTTRPDTLFGTTFMVVAADAKLAGELVTDDQRPAYDAYLQEVRKASDIERLSTDREKSGVFLGRYAINPVNGQRIQIWASDYVLADYGTGAIMAVPGQDQRDWDFAKKFDLPIIRTVRPPDDFVDDAAYVGPGPAINSHNDEISLDGMPIAEAKSAIIAWLEQRGNGRGTVNFRLRDWLLSRQRYWDGLPGAHLGDARHALGGELLSALELALRFPLRGLGPCERALSGSDRELVALRLDLGEERAVLDAVALLEVELLEHPGHARRHLHVLESLDRADGGHAVLDALHPDGPHLDGEHDLPGLLGLLLASGRRTGASRRTEGERQRKKEKAHGTGAHLGTNP